MSILYKDLEATAALIAEMENEAETIAPKKFSKEALKAKKDDIKAKASEKNVFKKENRVRMKEDGAHNRAVDKLKFAWKHNNHKYIQKFFENTDKASAEEIWREAVYDNGGEISAEMLYDEFIDGANYICDPNKVQTMISPFNVYNLALYVHEGNQIEPDFILDSLADSINDASEDFGFEKPFNFTKFDENGVEIVEFDPQTNMAIPTIMRNEKKVLLNNKKLPNDKSITTVIDEMELELDQKKKLLATENKRMKMIKERTPAPKPEYVWPSNEELDKEADAYAETFLERMFGASSSGKKETEVENKSFIEEKKENLAKADKIITMIDSAVQEIEPKQTKKKSMNLKEVIDPFEAMGERTSGETVNPKKESVSRSRSKK